MAAIQDMTTWIPDSGTYQTGHITYYLSRITYEHLSLIKQHITYFSRYPVRYGVLCGPCKAPLCVTNCADAVDGSSSPWWIHFHQMAAATHDHLESCCIIFAVTALMSVISTSLIRQFYKIGRLSLLFSKNKKTFKV